MLAAERAGAVARLVGPLSTALASRGMSRLYDEVERPLVRVLARMELVGVRVDTAELSRLARRTGRRGPFARAPGARVGRRPVPRQLGPAVARGAVQQARPHAGQEDQDRLLH